MPARARNAFSRTGTIVAPIGCRRGAIALVDREGRIGPLETVFFDTLIDENAATHIALVNAYDDPVEDAADKARINPSHVHIDLMIGGAELAVDGITRDGDVVPVFRAAPGRSNCRPVTR
jgi:aminopeptidase